MFQMLSCAYDCFYIKLGSYYNAVGILICFCLTTCHSCLPYVGTMSFFSCSVVPHGICLFRHSVLDSWAVPTWFWYSEEQHNILSFKHGKATTQRPLTHSSVLSHATSCLQKNSPRFMFQPCLCDPVNLSLPCFLHRTSESLSFQGSQPELCTESDHTLSVPIPPLGGLAAGFRLEAPVVFLRGDDAKVDPAPPSCELRCGQQPSMLLRTP